MRMVRRAWATAAGSALRPGPIRMQSAACWAREVPLPTATDTSAPASTGESLMPSPTMPTMRPSCCIRRTRSSLPVGVQAGVPGRRCRAGAPTARTGPGWSPLAIASRIPAALQCCQRGRRLGPDPFGDFKARHELRLAAEIDGLRQRILGRRHLRPSLARSEDEGAGTDAQPLAVHATFQALTRQRDNIVTGAAVAGGGKARAIGCSERDSSSAASSSIRSGSWPAKVSMR